MKILGPGLQTQTTLAGQTPFQPSPIAAHPMAVLLFGKRTPRRLDPRRYPGLKRALRKMRAIADEVAELVGRSGDDFPLSLCEGENAAISREGELFVGAELLEEHERDSDLLLGILGHEIGHRPWTWPTRLGRLTKKQLDALYREEEAKADRFAGKVLAELGGDPDAICDFLRAHASFEVKQPSDYYPPAVRAKMIRDAYARRLRTLRAGKAILGASGMPGRELR